MKGKVKQQPLNSSHRLPLICWLTSLAEGSCRAFSGFSFSFLTAGSGLQVQLDEESILAPTRYLYHLGQSNEN